MGYAVLLVALVILIIDITAVQLARARLYDVADALALDASDALAVVSIYRQGLGRAVPLTDETVRGAARTLLSAQQRPPNVSSWWLAEETGAGAARSSVAGQGATEGAVVALTGRIEVPLGSGFLDTVGGHVIVTVRSHAESSIRPPAVGW